MNNWRHPVFSLGEDFPMFELKYDWSRRFQFEFEWIELTIVDNKLGRNGQLAGDWEGKVGGRIRSRNTAASFSNQKKLRRNFCQKVCFMIPTFSSQAIWVIATASSMMSHHLYLWKVKFVVKSNKVVSRPEKSIEWFFEETLWTWLFIFWDEFHNCKDKEWHHFLLRMTNLAKNYFHWVLYEAKMRHFIT